MATDEGQANRDCMSPCERPIGEFDPDCLQHPTDCTDLGTCDACTDVAYQDTGWCLTSSEVILTRSNCLWDDWWGDSHIGCSAGLWTLRIDDGDWGCDFSKAISWCPEGTYCLDDDDCKGDCADTLDVYPV